MPSTNKRDIYTKEYVFLAEHLKRYAHCHFCHSRGLELLMQEELRREIPFNNVSPVNLKSPFWREVRKYFHYRYKLRCPECQKETNWLNRDLYKMEEAFRKVCEKDEYVEAERLMTL